MHFKKICSLVSIVFGLLAAFCHADCETESGTIQSVLSLEQQAEESFRVALRSPQLAMQIESFREIARLGSIRFEQEVVPLFEDNSLKVKSIAKYIYLVGDEYRAAQLSRRPAVPASSVTIKVLLSIREASELGRIAYDANEISLALRAFVDSEQEALNSMAIGGSFSIVLVGREATDSSYERCLSKFHERLRTLSKKELPVFMRAFDHMNNPFLSSFRVPLRRIPLESDVDPHYSLYSLGQMIEAFKANGATATKLLESNP